MLPLAIIFITSALVFYTIGVWAEKIQKILKPWHVVVFWIGLVCDILGTTFMSIIAKQTEVVSVNIHGITGFLAIVLMLVHVVWATYVSIKKNEKLLHSFHKFSVFVWSFWLIPYFIGMFMGISK